MDRFLLYSRHGHVTGGDLGEALGIPHGRDMPDERVDYLVRWGSSARIRYVPNIRTYNLRRAIAANTNKLNSLVQMNNTGVPVPPFSENWRELSFPLIGRSSNHMAGRDVMLYFQPMDIEVKGPSDYYLEYIPKRLEYRVHVIGNEIVKVSQKVLTEPEEYNPLVWNYENGFTFRNPREEHAGLYMAMSAVRAMELDFGAVDLIVGEDDRPYILEVNTAPGLDEPSLEVYIEKFRQLLEL